MLWVMLWVMLWACCLKNMQCVKWPGKRLALLADSSHQLCWFILPLGDDCQSQVATTDTINVGALADLTSFPVLSCPRAGLSHKRPPLTLCGVLADLSPAFLFYPALGDDCLAAGGHNWHSQCGLIRHNWHSESGLLQPDNHHLGQDKTRKLVRE